jgi:hypothetical protein
VANGNGSALTEDLIDTSVESEAAMRGWRLLLPYDTEILFALPGEQAKAGNAKVGNPPTAVRPMKDGPPSTQKRPFPKDKAQPPSSRCPRQFSLAKQVRLEHHLRP